MSDETTLPADAAPPPPPPPPLTRTKPKFGPKSAAIAVTGMVLGALVGIAVQAAVAATGVLGPGLDVLIDDQLAGFDQLEAKLEALRTTNDPAQVLTLVGDLEALLKKQKSLTERTHEELRGAREEIEHLKTAALEAQGSAVGADLWLKPGESATIGRRDNVFSLQRIWSSSNLIRINASGKNQDLNPGDYVEFPDGTGSIKVFYKQAESRADGRRGFDVVPVEHAGDAEPAP